MTRGPYAKALIHPARCDLLLPQYPTPSLEEDFFNFLLFLYIFTSLYLYIFSPLYLYILISLYLHIFSHFPLRDLTIFLLRYFFLPFFKSLQRENEFTLRRVVIIINLSERGLSVSMSQHELLIQ